jgi:phage terminase large subunit-like protein
MGWVTMLILSFEEGATRERWTRDPCQMIWLDRCPSQDKYSVQVSVGFTPVHAARAAIVVPARAGMDEPPFFSIRQSLGE